MTKQSAFNLRPYHPSDASHVVEMINTGAGLTLGAKQAVVDGVGHLRLARYVPSDCDKVVVINAQDEIVGFAYCRNVEHCIVFQLGGAVHPDYWGRGIGSRLAAWAEQRAASLGEQAPPGIKVVLQTNLFTAEQAAIELFEKRGYAKVREWAHLVVELDNQPPAPMLPGGLSLREMELENDWERVGPAMDEAFANHWGTITESFMDVEAESGAEAADEVEDDSYSNSPGFCFIVLAGDNVVGGVLSNGKLVERSDTGRVGSLFVRPSYQRQGIGRALMLAAFSAFWKSGIRRIITDTDAESFSDTPRFYASLGMTLYRREFLFEKEIRPGREVRRLEK